MEKPGRRKRSPSDEIALFTDREEIQALFRRYLSSVEEPPVLMFYGIGGAGKSWLLRKLRSETPADVPLAILDFDIHSGGQRFILDPSAALYEIRQQIAKPTPRFDLAFAILRCKQGIPGEPGLWFDIAGELIGSWIPGANTAIKMLSGPLKKRMKNTSVERFLYSPTGDRFALEMRARTSQEIGDDLLNCLADDLRASLTPHLNRAVSAVLLFDTFEAVSAGLQNNEHQRLREQWIKDVAANFDFALTVIAGQNRLTWEQSDPSWAECLEQHLIGGLAEVDAREFLTKCEILDLSLQEVILATALESGGGHHCFTLGLCADIVYAERRRGRSPLPETLRFRPQDWESLSRRFLKSLDSEAERRWIERLALTPRFDEQAGRYAYSREHSAAQDAEWDALQDYSFVEPLLSVGWFTIRSQMRWALENQPSAKSRIESDHEMWRSYWSIRAQTKTDEAASLAWYHHLHISPVVAAYEWNVLAEQTRNSNPPQMKQHFDLLQWWEPVGILDSPPSSPEDAWRLNCFGVELVEASLGDRCSNLRQAIDCYNAALRVYTERDFPREWALTQNNLGNAWSSLPTGDRTQNLANAIECLEAALRVRTEHGFPQDWAMTQLNLSKALCDEGSRTPDLLRALTCCESVLRVLRESESPVWWARAQNHLGYIHARLAKDDPGIHLSKAFERFDAALRVRTEKAYPIDWAKTQLDLGLALLSTAENESVIPEAEKARTHFENCQRVIKRGNFPDDWAVAESGLGMAYLRMGTGNRETNLLRAISHFEAAVSIHTEQAFPEQWARIQNNLSLVYRILPSGNKAENLRRAIAYGEAALRVHTEKDSPLRWSAIHRILADEWLELPSEDRSTSLHSAIQCLEAMLRTLPRETYAADWAKAQRDMGDAWAEMPTGDKDANLHRSISCYEAAQLVYTEERYPLAWAKMQKCIAKAWLEMPTVDKNKSFHESIVCYKRALRATALQTEFPEGWAETQCELGIALLSLTKDNRIAIRQAIRCFEAALRVYTEQKFPEHWAAIQNNLGLGWAKMPTDDIVADLQKSVNCFESAMRIYTKRDHPEKYEALTRSIQDIGNAINAENMRLP